MELASYIDDLLAAGRYHFTTDEAARALRVSYGAARAAIRRLRQKGSVAMPHRGFNLIVPPEYRRLGCLPPDQFIPLLMDQLGSYYYTGLLSAAEFYGAAHQRPQVFQVVVATNRPMLRCGQVRVQFIARRNVVEMHVVRRTTPRGYLQVATAESTAFDLVGYSRHSGGLSAVGTVLSELAESLNADTLAELAPLSPVPWSQRLGYLLELVGAERVAEPLARYVAGAAREYVPLALQRRAGERPRSQRWRLVVNTDVEPDL